MKKISQKISHSVLRASVAASLAVPAVLGMAGKAFAAKKALTPEDLFGGKEQGSGTDFAGEAGLSSGNLIDTISSIIRVALGFLGIIAVVIILLGGFKWMTSGGNDEKVKKAKQLIFQGIIGLVIVLSSYAIASFVITSITTATAGAA